MSLQSLRAAPPIHLFQNARLCDARSAALLKEADELSSADDSDGSGSENGDASSDDRFIDANSSDNDIAATLRQRPRRGAPAHMQRRLSLIAEIKRKREARDRGDLPGFVVADDDYGSGDDTQGAVPALGEETASRRARKNPRSSKDGAGATNADVAGAASAAPLVSGQDAAVCEFTQVALLREFYTRFRHLYTARFPYADETGTEASGSDTEKSDADSYADSNTPASTQEVVSADLDSVAASKAPLRFVSGVQTLDTATRAWLLTHFARKCLGVCDTASCAAGSAPWPPQKRKRGRPRKVPVPAPAPEKGGGGSGSVPGAVECTIDATTGTLVVTAHTSTSELDLFVEALSANTDQRLYGFPAAAWNDVAVLRQRERNAWMRQRVLAWTEVPPPPPRGSGIAEGDAAIATAAVSAQLGQQIRTLRALREAHRDLTQLAEFFEEAHAHLEQCASTEVAAAAAARAAEPPYVPLYGALDAGELRRAIDAVLTLRDSIVGQHEVKCRFVRFVRERIERRGSLTEVSNNFVLYGRPGTGKTVVARLMATIFRAIKLCEAPSPKAVLDVTRDIYTGTSGELAADVQAVVTGATRDSTSVLTSVRTLLDDAASLNGDFLETTCNGLKACYQGMTQKVCAKFLMRCIGRTGFIDEAYNLDTGPQDGFGHEASGTLVALLTRLGRSVSLIIAGQRDEFECKLYAMNPGVESRFPNALTFKSYNAAECAKIAMLKMLHDGLLFFCTPETAAAATAAPVAAAAAALPLETERRYLTEFFAREHVAAALRESNARGIGSLVELAAQESVARTSARLHLRDAHKNALRGLQETRIFASDFEGALETYLRSLERSAGDAIVVDSAEEGRVVKRDNYE